MRRSVSIKAVVAVGLTAVCLALSACTAEPGPVPERPSRYPRSPATTAAATMDGCPADGRGLVPPFHDVDSYAGSVPRGETALVSLIRCEVADERQQDSGSMVYTIDESSAPLPGELTTALGLPDLAPPGDAHVVCDARAQPVLYLLLVDRTGRGYRPRIPVTWCGEPRTEVLSAVADIDWTSDRTFQISRD